MKAVHQYQDYGCKFLEQPCHVIWLEAENADEEMAVRALMKRASFGNLTGYHSIDEKKGDTFSAKQYPKTFIFRMPDKTAAQLKATIP